MNITRNGKTYPVNNIRKDGGTIKARVGCEEVSIPREVAEAFLAAKPAPKRVACWAIWQPDGSLKTSSQCGTHFEVRTDYGPAGDLWLMDGESTVTYITNTPSNYAPWTGTREQYLAVFGKEPA